MWVSTGNAGIEKACIETTDAVLWPTPGRDSKEGRSLGTFPSNFSKRILDRFQIALALFL